jgi:hypothetical protein
VSGYPERQCANESELRKESPERREDGSPSAGEVAEETGQEEKSLWDEMRSPWDGSWEYLSLWTILGS